ncbi:MAG: hypothetical protein HY088_08585 [Ignavibacteriales bacterium]|nr:hypothetical protein [Ignavibacteriales bacterium]
MKGIRKKKTIEKSTKLDARKIATDRKKRLMLSLINIQNPGSALGEAIGAEMESALNRFLDSLANNLGFHFVSSGLKNSKTGKTHKKLLLADKFGTNYNIDSVIANEKMQPIILVESKYIRYKKHNRDKGSWLCTAHPALRRRYTSIRSSVAVLAGSWSKSSLAMMKSYDINFFVIPFDKVCEFLSVYDIDFNWGEKDRNKAIEAWSKYSKLSKTKRAGIGQDMVNLVKDELEKIIVSILDDTIERKVDKVLLELHSNIGEVKTYEFASVDEAIEFLNREEFKEIFVTTDSDTLYDPPPSYGDEEEHDELVK